MKKRIWELDAFRGICIIGMVLVHLFFDLCVMYRIVDWELPAWFSFVQNWGGVLFLLISGISATLGSRSVRRGLIVLGCGMAVTAVTVGMYLLKMASIGIIIYFGVLQCLGVCMILWPLFKKLPWWALATLGIVFVTAGMYLARLPAVDVYYLMPLGLPWNHFLSADYFPLLPYFGYFLLGGALGRTLYGKKQSLLPNVNEKQPVLAFFQLCGKLSLPIYLLHQPLISGICMLFF